MDKRIRGNYQQGGSENTMIMTVMLIVLIFTGIFMTNIGLKVFSSWKKYRDTTLLHLTLIFFYIVLITIVFTSIIILINFVDNLLQPKLLYTLAIFYDLFYLEIALFYLATFPNSSGLHEKYLPIIISMSMIINIILIFSLQEIYFLLSFVFHASVVIIGIYLLVKAILKLNLSKNYFKKAEEKELIEYLISICKIVVMFLVADAVGFYIWLYLALFTPITVTWIDVIILIPTSVLGFLIIGFIFNRLKIFAKKAEKIDIVHFLNTIS